MKLKWPEREQTKSKQNIWFSKQQKKSVPYDHDLRLAAKLYRKTADGATNADQWDLAGWGELGSMGCLRRPWERSRRHPPARPVLWATAAAGEDGSW